MDNGSQHPSSEPSFVSLLGGIANDATELLLREVALTKLEVQYELRKAKTAAIALGIGIGTIATGGILLMLMLVHVLAALTEVPLWGCYGIVGSALVVLGGVRLAAGKTKTEELDVVPQRTVERIKESAQWLTKQTTSDKR
jgi:putative superfamily III holin-X